MNFPRERSPGPLSEETDDRAEKEHDMTEWLWMLMGLLGLAALAAGLAYGQYRSTHPAHTRSEDRRRDAATRELYRQEERERSEQSH